MYEENPFENKPKKEIMSYKEAVEYFLATEYSRWDNVKTEEEININEYEFNCWLVENSIHIYEWCY